MNAWDLNTTILMFFCLGFFFSPRAQSENANSSVYPELFYNYLWWTNKYCTFLLLYFRNCKLKHNAECNIPPIYPAEDLPTSL